MDKIALRRLEFLDLNIPNKNKVKQIDSEFFRIKCNFENFQHEIHTENKQLNTLVDLLINLSSSLEKVDKDNKTLLRTIIHNQNNLESKVDKIFNNLDFIKNQRINPLANIHSEIIDIKKSIKEIDKSINIIKTGS